MYLVKINFLVICGKLLITQKVKIEFFSKKIIKYIKCLISKKKLLIPFLLKFEIKKNCDEILSCLGNIFVKKNPC
jgi:hypothetical protein